MNYGQKMHKKLRNCYQQAQVRNSVQIFFGVEKCKQKVMLYETTFDQKPPISFGVDDIDIYPIDLKQ